VPPASTRTRPSSATRHRVLMPPPPPPPPPDASATVVDRSSTGPGAPPTAGQRQMAPGLLPPAHGASLRETPPLSQGVQAGRKALRMRHIHGMEVRKKERKKRTKGVQEEAQGGSSEPPEPRSVSPWPRARPRSQQPRRPGPSGSRWAGARKVLGWPQKMPVGPCITLGIQPSKAEVGPLLVWANYSCCATTRVAIL
jgi:hypothetical protein